MSDFIQVTDLNNNAMVLRKDMIVAVQKTDTEEVAGAGPVIIQFHVESGFQGGFNCQESVTDVLALLDGVEPE